MAHLFVIAGHGHGDSGAVGNGYTEAERVRALASRLALLGGGNVTVGDTSRNWYADKGITSLNIPKDWQILELHMDSASASARGGHVIIKSGYAPDRFDNALANFIGKRFPGRSQLIVGRSNLANVNRAATKGYNYRLLECGFISNSTDVKIFNDYMDDNAKEILKAFDINTKNTTSSSNASSNKNTPIDGYVNNGGTFQSKKDVFGDVSYQVHVRDIGWCNWQCDGAMVGSIGQNRRIEAVRFNGLGNTDIEVHIRDIGDKKYTNVKKDEIVGTIGQGRRIEAIKITGHDTFYRYRVHQKNIGWSEWVDNGEWAGTKGKGLQLEAIQIQRSMFSVEAHVQSKGWIKAKSAENIIGITGHSLRLEAIRFNLYGNEIKAKAFVQSKGWVDYGEVNNNTIIGTAGESKRIECLCLEGNFDYRVHIQDSGWTPWTKADGKSTLGTVGQDLRIEAIQFRKR